MSLEEIKWEQKAQSDLRSNSNFDEINSTNQLAESVAINTVGSSYTPCLCDLN